MAASLVSPPGKFPFSQAAKIGPQGFSRPPTPMKASVKVIQPSADGGRGRL
ncbi:hypothetical protein D3C86_1866100 [compost metagenome]